MRKSIIVVLAILASGSLMGQDAGFFLNEWQEKNAEVPSHVVMDKVPGETSVQINVDGAQVLNKVPTYIYGNNAVTWGGNMNLHATVMKDINSLDPHVLRWPGGNLSNHYFWNLSPGETPADVPSDIDAQFGMNVENWRMSTPQYYQLLESTGSTGSVCVNYSYARYGTGPNPVATAAHMAAEWVRYDNGRSKFWEIGNENFGSWQAGYQIDVSNNQDGQPEYINGQLYGQHCKVFMDSMRSAAAEIGVEIKIGVVAYDAETSYDPISEIWNEGMMPEVGDLADFLVVHSYFTPHNQDSQASIILNSHDVPSEIMHDIVNDMTEAGKNMIPVALTEWNIFAVRSMQQVSFINGMHAALVLGELVMNDFGLATRWDLTNSWADGDDHGMFSRGGEPGVDLYNPRPVFFYMNYFQKYFGDRMLSSSVSGSEQVVSYASSFSSGETGMVLINKGTARQTVEVGLENIEQGAWYHTMTLTGGDDNGEFSRKVFLNGYGPDEEGGGPDDYETIKAHAFGTRGGIKVDLPPLSVVYLMVESPGPLSYISSRIEEDPRVVHVELSEDVQAVTDPSEFTLFLADGTEVGVVSIERDPVALYQLNLGLDRDISNSDKLTLSYHGTGVQSTVGDLLPAFQNEAVVNRLPADPFTVCFHLTSSQNDQSLADCLVGFNGEEGFTNNAGSACFVAREGVYSVDVEKIHLLPIREQLLTVVSDTIFELSLDSATYEVSFQVSDHWSGDPLSLTTVATADKEGVTGAEGVVALSLFAGAYTFDLDRFNYLEEQVFVDVQSDTLLKVTLERSHARVKFRLRFGEQPVNNASVIFLEDTLISNSLGQAIFESVPVFSISQYRIEREAYIPIDGSLEVSADTTVLLQMEKSTVGFDPGTGPGIGLLIYPNPASEQIFIESGGQVLSEVEILDLSGKVLLRVPAFGTTLRLDLPAGMSSGVYILRTRIGHEGHTERLMINTSL